MRKPSEIQDSVLTGDIALCTSDRCSEVLLDRTYSERDDVFGQALQALKTCLHGGIGVKQDDLRGQK